ncbi:modification methylase DpnIIB [bacterium BMS3Bbin03]|nr:modification methylase DpnIIB [bacterium BMS3Bbin03]
MLFLEWFIKLFTNEGDTVLDPFMGSGTTVVVARRMGRSSLGIDIVPEFVEMTKSKIEPYKNTLFEKRDIYGRDNKPDKGEYQKLCGQRFWTFLSGDDLLYTDIIEPLGHKAKEKN